MNTTETDTVQAVLLMIPDVQHYRRVVGIAVVPLDSFGIPAVRDRFEVLELQTLDTGHKVFALHGDHAMSFMELPCYVLWTPAFSQFIPPSFFEWAKVTGPLN